jgi:elongator complex protein 3
MNRSPWKRFQYNPQADEAQLAPLISEFLKVLPDNDKAWRRLLKKYPKPKGGFFSKTEMIAGYRALQNQYQWEVDESELLSALKMKPTRTQSGVAPVTVLTKPYPCPGQCIFCPNDVRMPKSYLADEPGAQRATLNRFDPYAQTWNRLLALYRMGHPVAKVELIVLGGTWSSYPKSYQLYFITRLFEAVNDFGTTKDPQPYDPPSADQPNFLDLEPLDNIVPAEGESINLYNHIVARHLRKHHQGTLLASHEGVDWERLHKVHQINEDAQCRVVGLVIETRPDEISVKEALYLRKLGATKIQIGVQSLSDEVLLLNRRGHDVAQARFAIEILRQAGFKLHIHWMANLYGATVQGDIEDFQKLFTDPAICPDEIKLYPCSLIEHTELMTYYKQNKWTPYTRSELLEILCQVMPKAPVYCRLSRVIRDIPSTAIHEGNQETNFREVAEKKIAEDGIKLREIRSREVKLKHLPQGEIELKTFTYPSSVSQEVFLSFEIADHLLGFCRLSLPSRKAICTELENSAMIREVHVYGQSLVFGESHGGRTQHRGLGKRLIQSACSYAKDHGFTKIAVISAIGTKYYYRKLGFKDAELYQHKIL